MLAFICSCLISCGPGLGGTYIAEVEQTRDRLPSEPGYQPDEIRAQLKSAPRSIEVHVGGRFQTAEGGQTVWEGRWRVEGRKLYLRAETVKGIRVLEKLQADKEFTLAPDGAIWDDGTYGFYGFRLAYRKR